MRTMTRFLTMTGLVAASATAIAAQPPRGPVRPLPPAARERQFEMRERMLERREEMLERRGAARLGAQAGARAGFRAGMRAGAGMRGRMGPGMRAGMRPGMGPGGQGRIRERAIERRAVIRDRYEALTPAQREALFKYREAARTERFRVGEEIRAGKLTREQARERLQKWRETNKPPVDLRGPARPGRPEGDN